MHERIREATRITNANCFTCSYLGSDGDGPEYNGNWLVCTEKYERSHLKSFPFKKDMKCWKPDFWHSKFAEEIKTGDHEEIMELIQKFCNVIDVAKEGE